METTKSAETVLLETKATIISWNAMDKYIHVYHKGYSSSADYLANLAKQLEFVQQKKATKILFDLTNMGVIGSDNQKYTNEVYMPTLFKAGCKYSAIVLPENIFGEASVNNVINKDKGATMSSKLFKDTKVAVDWLKSQA